MFVHILKKMLCKSNSKSFLRVHKVSNVVLPTFFSSSTSFQPRLLVCVLFFRSIFHFRCKYILWKFNSVHNAERKWCNNNALVCTFAWMWKRVSVYEWYMERVFFRLVYMYIKSHSSTFSNNTNGDWGIATTKHSYEWSIVVEYSWNVHKFGKIDAATTNPINSCLFLFVCLLVRACVSVCVFVFRFSHEKYMNIHWFFSLRWQWYSDFIWIFGVAWWIIVRARCKLWLASLFPRTQFSLHILLVFFSDARMSIVWSKGY